MDPKSLGLPHREPFLFLDRIVELDPGISATAEKTFAAEDAMFRGHFPGNPIVPGVILTEALAQLAGIAGAGPEGRAFLLSGIRAMKFPSAARPGETIRLHARKAGGLGALLQFEVEATAPSGSVAVGQIILNEVPADGG